MATDTIECPDCGAEIGSTEQVDVEEVSEITSKPQGGIGYGDATQNLFLCKQCKKPLGVGRRNQ